MEHRIRTDQDQGQPRPDQLVERPAIRRPQHRQQRVQPRPRLRILRRVQPRPHPGVRPGVQGFGDARRRPQLGLHRQRRTRLHGTSGTLPAGALLGQRRRHRRRLRRRGAGPHPRGRRLRLQPQGLAPRRTARRRHARRRHPQHRLLFRGFHPQIPRIRLLHRLHGPHVRRPALRNREFRLRVQRLRAQRPAMPARARPRW